MSPPRRAPPSPSPLPRDLPAALARLRTLQSHNAAHLATIDSLNTLLATEQIQTRVTKRKLRTLQASPPPSAETLRLRDELPALRLARDAATAENAQLARRLSAAEAARDATDAHSTLLTDRLAARDAAASDSLRALRDAAARDAASLAQALRARDELQIHTDQAVARVTQLQDLLLARDKALVDLPPLRARIIELQHAVREKDAALAAAARTPSPSVSPPRPPGSPSRRQARKTPRPSADPAPTELRRRVAEVAISRAVIAEKDKILVDLRAELAALDARRQEADLALQTVRAREAASANELRDARAALVAPTTPVAAREAQLQSALQEREAQLETAACDVDALRKACEQADTRQVQAMLKVQTARKELDEAREQIAQLKLEVEDARKRAQVAEESDAEESPKSPALTEPEPEPEPEQEQEQEVDPATDAEPSESEGTSSPEQAGFSSRPVAARDGCGNVDSEPPNTTAATSANANGAIETLRRALQVSRTTCAEKEQQLSASQEAAAQLDKTVRKLRSELTARLEECETLHRRVHDELEPALRRADGAVEEQSALLSFGNQTIAELEAAAEGTRATLQEELDDTNARLQDTLTAFDDAQNMFLQSEQKGAELQEQVTSMTEERRMIGDKVKELTDVCEHRMQALLALQGRLAEVEAVVADHEQTALDATRTKEQLERLLAQARDRQDVAEKRAARKEALLHDLEGRKVKLDRTHKSALLHLEQKTAIIEHNESELAELKKVLCVREDGLQDQARLACRQQSLFDTQTRELQAVVAHRGNELKDTQDGLQAAEQQVEALTKSLVDSAAQLRCTEHELAESKRDFSSSEAEKQRIEVKVSELQEEIMHVRAEYRTAQTELSAKDEQISSQFESIGERGSKIVALRAEKTELETALSSLHDDLVQQKALSTRHSDRSCALDEELAAAKLELAACKQDLSVSSAEADSLSRSLSSVQTELIRYQNLVNEKNSEINSNLQAVRALERALTQSKQELDTLELHLDGHDTLLKECREKDEELANQIGELERAKEQNGDMMVRTERLRSELTERTEEIEALSRNLATLEAAKVIVEGDLDSSETARRRAEQTISSLSVRLSSLEKSSSKEIADLTTTLTSLRDVLDERQAALASASETISKASVQSTLAKEQLADSRTRGDRLFAQLSSTEQELSWKKDSLAELEIRFINTQEALRTREIDVSRLEQGLADRNHSLTVARSRIDELTTKTGDIGSGELKIMRTRVKEKERAVNRLNSWSSVIRARLNAAEMTLSERELDLEISSTAFKKLEAQVEHLNYTLGERESQVLELESSRNMEISELRSKIQTLQAHAEGVNDQLEKTKQLKISEGEVNESSLVAMASELRECRENVQSKEIELSEAMVQNESLQNTAKLLERDLTAARKTVESLSLEVGRLRVEVKNRQDAKDFSDEHAAKEVSKVRSETEYLMVEFRRAEAELVAANESSASWKAKVAELQPLAESAFEAQRALERSTSRLALSETDARHQMDLLEMQLKDAIRERDIAERDCAAAVSNCTQMRAKLAEANKRRSAYGSNTALKDICTVTFTLSGIDCPGPEVMVYVMGGDVTLGQWSPSRRLPLRVIEGGERSVGVVRQCDVILPAIVSTAYKYVADGPDGNIVWEGGENRPLDLRGSLVHEVSDTWRVPV